MIYKTTKQYGSGRETQDSEFKTLEEAKAHAQQAAESDAAMKINSVYRVYEFDDVLEVIDSTKIEMKREQESSQSGSSAGRGASSSFSPTPFSTSAKPKGAVQHWGKKDDDDKKK